MAKIKITDLAKDEKISKEEMKKVFGGLTSIDFTAPIVEVPTSGTQILKPGSTKIDGCLCEAFCPDPCKTI